MSKVVRPPGWRKHDGDDDDGDDDKRKPAQDVSAEDAEIEQTLADLSELQLVDTLSSVNDQTFFSLCSSFKRAARYCGSLVDATLANQTAVVTEIFVRRFAKFYRNIFATNIEELQQKGVPSEVIVGRLKEELVPIAAKVVGTDAAQPFLMRNLYRAYLRMESLKKNSGVEWPAPSFVFGYGRDIKIMLALQQDAPASRLYLHLMARKSAASSSYSRNLLKVFINNQRDEEFKGSTVNVASFVNLDGTVLDGELFINYVFKMQIVYDDDLDPIEYLDYRGILGLFTSHKKSDRAALKLLIDQIPRLDAAASPRATPNNVWQTVFAQLIEWENGADIANIVHVVNRAPPNSLYQGGYRKFRELIKAAGVVDKVYPEDREWFLRILRE